MKTCRIEKESDDIFASDEGSIETPKNGPSQMNAEEEDDDGSKMSAAAALTSLIAGATSISKKEKDEADDDDDDDDDEEGYVAQYDSKGFEIPQRFTKSGRKRAVPFPIKLMKVLSNKKFNEVIAWTPSGKSFNIVKPKQFVADILPSQFKSAKYSSFTRKLHRWGFMRHYRGEEAGAYHHEMFQKDRLDLVEQMTCHKQEPAKSANAVHEQKATVGRVVPTITPAPQVAAARARNLGHESMVHASSLTANPSLAMHNRDFLPAAPASLPCIQAVRQVPPTPSLTVNHSVLSESTSGGVDLNAAIEMEVARRLQERLDSASYNRQAFALMQHQQQMRVQQLQAQQLQAQQRFLQQHAYSNVGMLMRNQPPPLSQLNHLQLPSLGLAQLYNKIKSHPQSRYLAFGSAPASLPENNIQGARTA